MELTRWRSRYLAIEPHLRPASPAVAIKDCDAPLFPNISILLQIACTIPVISCECERSASTLRLLNNYMRSSMEKIACPILRFCTFTALLLWTWGHCSKLLYSATPPSTSTGKSSAKTVTLILFDNVTLKVRFKRKGTHPGKNQPTGLLTSNKFQFTLFGWLVTVPGALA